MASWCGARVYRLPDPTMVPLTELPAIFVTANRTQQQPDLQSENDVFVELKVVGFYEEGRDSVTPSERTVKSMVELWLEIFAGTGEERYLVVPRFGKQLLVDRLDQVFDTDYQIVEQPQPNLEEGESSPNIVRAVEQRFLYKYGVDADSRIKTGFDPDLGWSPEFLTTPKIVWVRPEEHTSGDVASWPDQSGNGFDPSQPTPGQRPTVLDNALDGWKGVQFNPANSEYLSVSYGQSFSQPIFIAIVCRFPTSNVKFIYDGGTSTTTRLVMQRGNGEFLLVTGETGKGLFLDFAGRSGTYFRAYVFHDGPNSELRTPFDSVTGDAGANPTDGLFLASTLQPGAFSDTVMLELLILDGLPSAEELAFLDEYFDARYPSAA